MTNLYTILDWIRYCTTEMDKANLYYGHGTETPLDEAAALVLGMLNLPYNLSTEYFHARLTQAEQTLLKDALNLRITKRMPVPYITHRTLYGGYDFYVDERVLIPRSPIAELIEQNLAPWWHEEQEPEKILDLCCGSGCIGILAKLFNPHTDVTLADIDSSALEVARINLERFGMQDCGVDIIQSDGFAQISERYDWILCNPPYVEESEMEEIAPEFKHEPLHALVSGHDGLNLTRKILNQAADYLTPDGILILEVGMSGYLLEEAYPDIDFDWITFKHGGHGVFAMSAVELLSYRDAGKI